VWLCGDHEDEYFGNVCPTETLSVILMPVLLYIVVYVGL